MKITQKRVLLTGILAAAAASGVVAYFFNMPPLRTEVVILAPGIPAPTRTAAEAIQAAQVLLVSHPSHALYERPDTVRYNPDNQSWQVFFTTKRREFAIPTGVCILVDDASLTATVYSLK